MFCIASRTKKLRSGFNFYPLKEWHYAIGFRFLWRHKANYYVYWCKFKPCDRQFFFHRWIIPNMMLIYCNRILEVIRNT